MHALGLHGLDVGGGLCCVVHVKTCVHKIVLTVTSRTQSLPSTMSLFCSIFILVSLLCWLLVSAAPNSTSIYFSYITSITGAGFRSGGARPVVDLALEQINNRTDILPNYTLSYRTIRDSKVNKIQMWHSVRSPAVYYFLFSAM